MATQAPEVVTVEPVETAVTHAKNPKRVAAGKAVAEHNKAMREAQEKRMEQLLALEKRQAEREKQTAELAAKRAAKQQEPFFTSNRLWLIAGAGAGGLLLYAGRNHIKGWLSWFWGGDPSDGVGQISPVRTTRTSAPAPQQAARQPAQQAQSPFVPKSVFN